MYRVLSIAGVLLSSAALAQINVNPVGPQPSGSVPQSHWMVPQQGTVMAWMPWQSQSSGIGTTFNTLGVGRTAMMSVELEGDPVAIQVVLYNGSATAWKMAQIGVASSASYGPAGTLSLGGVSPYDITGTAQQMFLPVPFAQGGINSQPWNPNTFKFTGTAATSGYQMSSLLLSGAEAAGQTVLDFATTISPQTIGGRQPGIGQWVADGRGCIAPGTKVTAVTSTTVTIDTAVTATGCLSGQNIYFSVNPIPALSVGVAPTANSVQGTLVYSDWVFLPSLPRTDGGIVAGMAASCTGCPSGAVVRSVSSSTITISGGGTVATNIPVTFSMAPSTVGATSSGQAWLRVGSVTGLQVGQIVTGSTAIPASTYVTDVQASGLVRLSAAVTAAIPASTALTFSNVVYTNAASTATDATTTLSVQSTSAKRLYTFRAVVESGSPTGWNKPAGIQAAQRDLGYYARFFQSGAASDSINVPGNYTNVSAVGGESLITPFYSIRYVTRQKGATVCTMGDSKLAGGGTANNGNNFVLRAATALSTPNRPVAAIQTANGGTSGAIFTPQLMQWVQNGTCSVIVAQVNTQNVGNSWDTSGYIGAMGQLIQQAGVRSILVADTPRGARSAYTYRVTSAVSNSTRLPLNQRIGQGFKNAGGSGYCISGTGIPTGATFSYTMGDDFVTTSVPVNVAANTIVSIFNCMAVSTTSGLTAVTLSTASPVTTSGVDLTGNPNIAAGTTMSVTQDSTSGTLSANATGTGAAVATTFWQNPATYIPIAQTGAGLWAQASSNSQPFYDAGFCLMDPADPGFYLQRYTYDGVHQNDEGNQAIADGVTTAPFPGCPSFTSVLRQVIGQ